MAQWLGRVGVQAVVRKALRKGKIKRNLRIKRREGESKLGVLLVFLVPCCGAGVTSRLPEASGKFGASLSKKDRAASDTQEERPALRNLGLALELGEGRLAGHAAWCQEQGWGTCWEVSRGWGERGRPLGPAEGKISVEVC